MAWIIGWDLALEYMIGGAAVARGWSGYVLTVIIAEILIFFKVFCVAPGLVSCGSTKVDLPDSNWYVKLFFFAG